jgi:hypothetical protein
VEPRAVRSSARSAATPEKVLRSARLSAALLARRAAVLRALQERAIDRRRGDIFS